MIEWLKDCEICNAGVCKRVDADKGEAGGAKAVCKIMEAEAADKYGFVVWTWQQIYARYRYYKGLMGRVRKPHPEDEDNQILEGQTKSLESLLEQNEKFGTIYADPPWPYQNQGTRSSTSGIYKSGQWQMSVEDISNLPIENLTKETAHLHLWTTNAFLFECPEIMEAWGFEYRSILVWVKPQMGIGNYWRVSHEFLVLGIKGKGATFPPSAAEKSWIEYNRTKHSVKPDIIAEKIEKVSPGPYLELFARRARPNWTVWGNEIERTLFNANL